MWHPRIQDDAQQLSQALTLDTEQSVIVTLEQPLLPSLESYEDDTNGYFDYE